MHGSCYINRKVSGGASLIIWEEQRDLFLKIKGKNPRKQRKCKMYLIVSPYPLCNRAVAFGCRHSVHRTFSISFVFITRTSWLKKLYLVILN